MSIPVSAAFLSAAFSDANIPVSTVKLALGNYASNAVYGTTVSSSGDAANYPAAGAIDGDRTELNVGPASGADNDVGLSSWRSSAVPTTGAPVSLQINFTAARDINRIKLYHLTGKGLSNFVISAWVAGAWSPIICTSTNALAGTTPTVITTTGTMDTIDFPDVTTTKLLLQVYASSDSSYANVVELEIYRLIDITSRCKGINIKRARDYKLGNPLASTIQLKVNNDDRFFSVNHVPTAAEAAAGFVNQELRPGLGIFVWMGFQLDNGVQQVQNFVGSLDTITLTPRTRDAELTGRDGMKILVNKQTDYSKLKSNVDVTAAIQYVLNRANVSTFESLLDTTGISLPKFFTSAQDHLSTIRDLVQASGDALFFFDENGIARFKFYSTAINQSATTSTQAQWLAGTLYAIDANTTPGDISYKLDPAVSYANATGLNHTHSNWTLYSGSATNVSDVASGWQVMVNNAEADFVCNQTNADCIGDWLFNLQWGGIQPGPVGLSLGFMVSTPGTVTGTPSVGYAVVMNGFSGALTLNRGATILATTSFVPSSGTTYLVGIRRTAAGVFTVFINGVQKLTATDLTYTSGQYICYGVYQNNVFGYVIFKNTTYPSFPNNNGLGTWDSPSLDCGSTIITFGVLSITRVLNGGTITAATRTSPDNATWSAWLNVDGTGQILSPTNRYIDVQLTLAPSVTGASPTVQDYTVNWATGGGSVKYPSNAQYKFQFNDVNLDVQQQISANVGGDSSIINDVVVQAQPLVLSGNSTDTQWQGTVGVPPVKISVSNPLSVTNGQVLTLTPVVSGGMDISSMSGANPAAVVVTFASGGAGSWVVSSIHPTQPVVKITITGSGLITDLRLIGYAYQSADYIQAQEVTAPVSIANYGQCQVTIDNTWITSAAEALSIATLLVNNFQNPVSYIPSMDIRLMPSVQLGDRCTVVDDNLDMSQDYIVIGHSHDLQASSKETVSFKTNLMLMQVPAGL